MGPESARPPAADMRRSSQTAAVHLTGTASSERLAYSVRTRRTQRTSRRRRSAYELRGEKIAGVGDVLRHSNPRGIRIVGLIARRITGAITGNFACASLDRGVEEARYISIDQADHEIFRAPRSG